MPTDILREPDVHEDSYLSFMFQKDDDEEPTTSSKGRRTFGKNGKEVTKEEEKVRSITSCSSLINNELIGH